MHGISLWWGLNVRSSQAAQRIGPCAPILGKNLVTLQGDLSPTCGGDAALASQRHQPQSTAHAGSAVGLTRASHRDGFDFNIGPLQQEQDGHPVIWRHIGVDDHGARVITGGQWLEAEHTGSSCGDGRIYAENGDQSGQAGQQQAGRQGSHPASPAR